MPSETDSKTRLGLSQALTKANQIHGTLAAVDPESDNPDATAALRRARGLAAALVVAVQHLETVCYDLWQARPPRQLTLEDLLQSARRLVPSLRDDEDAAVREAADLEPEDDEEEDDEEPERMTALAEPKPEPSPAAANAREFFTSSADEIANALARAGRTIAVVEVEQWSEGERMDALAWARWKANGSEAPPPEHVSREYLEDWNLDTPEGLAAVLDRLDIPDTEEVAWDDEERPAIIAWAKSAYRWDRGEDVVVAPVPGSLVPEPGIYGAIKSAIAQRPDSPSGLIHRFRPEDFGAVFAVEALHEAGEIQYHAVSRQYRVDGEAELGTSTDVLGSLAVKIAERRLSDDADGELGDDADEEVEKPAPEVSEPPIEEPATEPDAEVEDFVSELWRVPTIGEGVARGVVAAGYDSWEAIAAADEGDLSEIPRLGKRKVKALKSVAARKVAAAAEVAPAEPAPEPTSEEPADTEAPPTSRRDELLAMGEKAFRDGAVLGASPEGMSDQEVAVWREGWSDAAMAEGEE